MPSQSIPPSEESSALVKEASAPIPNPPPADPEVRNTTETKTAKSYTLPIILILLLVTAIGSGSYYFLQYQKLTQSPQPTPIPSIEPTSTPNPAADWKTYTNTNLGFSFSYPPELALTDNLQTTLDPSAWTTKKTLTLTHLSNACTITLMINPDGFGPFFPNKTLQLSYKPTTGFTVSKEIDSFGTGNDEVNPNPEKYQVIFADNDLVGEIFGIWGSAFCPNNALAIAYVDQNLPRILSTFRFTDSADTSSQPSITSPLPNSVVESPLTITGTVPAGWMFEGTLPIELFDEQDNSLATITGSQLPGQDWTNGQPTRFTATLTFITSASSGYLVISKDNPSGLPENDQSYRLPVKF